MAKSPEPDEDPVAYPKDGTFGQLLKWHLEIWGTRPGCSTEEKNRPWVKSHFATFVNEHGLDPESATRSLRNWTNEGRLPEEHDQDKVDRIYRELFGDDPNLNAWKADLERALEKARRQKAALIARREVPQSRGVPRLTAHFMGRGEEVNALADMLATSDDAAAILVQGGPGIGKTELTKAIAHHDAVAGRFGERRFFAPLETAKSAAAMRDAILRAMGRDPSPDFVGTLRSLTGPDALLILDNLETPWSPQSQQVATEQVLSDLAATPGLAVLASFRGFEAIGGLRWRTHVIETLPDDVAKQLFASIAGQRALSDRRLQDFIGALAGVPLAIDLVARRAYGEPSLTPLWEEWIRVGADLAVRPGFQAERLTSLPHSIELSLQPLRSSPAMHLFSLLGVLPAGLRATEAEALLGDDAFTAAELLRRSGIASGSHRYDLLPPIREHARRHCPPEDAIWADHYVQLPNRIWSEITTIQTDDFDAGLCRVDELCCWFEVEFPNIESAIRHKISQDEAESTRDPFMGLGMLALRSSIATSIFEELSDAWRANGNMIFSATCLEAASDLADSLGDHDRMLHLNEQALATYRSEEDPQGEASCLHRLGRHQINRSDYWLARETLSSAISLARKAERPIQEADCLYTLGELEYDFPNPARAEDIFNEVVDKYATDPKSPVVALSLMRLGALAKKRGETDRALSLTRDAKAIFETYRMQFEIRDCERRIEKLTKTIDEKAY